MLQGSSTACTPQRRPLSLELSPARFFTVCSRRTTSTSVYLRSLCLFQWSILGIPVVLLFRCVTDLFNPVYCKRGGVKWGLVPYTVSISSCMTTHTAKKFNDQSISFIDNREFTDLVGTSLGPYGYQSVIRLNAHGIIPNVMYSLPSDLLANGFLVSSLFDIAPALPGA